MKKFNKQMQRDLTFPPKENGFIGDMKSAILFNFFVLIRQV